MVREESSDLKSRLFDHMHPQVRSEYEGGKSIAEYYIGKYGKEDLKKAMQNLSELMKKKPPNETINLYKSIKQHRLRNALKGFYDVLADECVIEEGKEVERNVAFLKFHSDWVLMNARADGPAEA